MQAIAKTKTNPLRIPVQGLFVGVMIGALWLAQSLTAVAQDRPVTFADLAEQVSPAVVNITTLSVIEPGDMNDGPVLPDGSPFEDFFRDFQDRQQDQDRSRRSQALGSGFFISADGYLVTNNHVIEDADEIMIETFAGQEFEATLVGTDPKTDIAVLKVDSDEPLPFVPFGNSDASRVGDWVMAMGNPLGQGFSVSAGIISARNRSLSGTYDDYIQTDAAINQGNSGGPLFNMNGEVIGVNTAILSPDGGSIGIGFSMASNVVTRVVDQLQEFGETRRGWLGVRIQNVTEDMAEAMGLDSTNGAMVTDVPDGPAADAGIEAGDVIVVFDGIAVEDTRGLVTIVGNAPVGKTVDVVVLRDGEEVTIPVTLGRRETAEADAEPQEKAPAQPREAEVLGMTLLTLTDDMRDELGFEAGQTGLLVSAVDEDSEAYEKGLRPGDLIEKAGQTSVETPEELEEAIEAARDAGRRSILMLVRSNGSPIFMALSVEE